MHLQGPTRAIQWVLVFGMWVYGVTRIVQFAVLATLLWGALHAQHTSAQSLVLLMITTLLLIIQVCHLLRCPVPCRPVCRNTSLLSIHKDCCSAVCHTLCKLLLVQEK